MPGAMAADDPKIPADPTPFIAASTDVAPLTHAQPKPPHERTADEEADVIDWEKLASSERFRNMVWIIAALEVFDAMPGCRLFYR